MRALGFGTNGRPGVSSAMRSEARKKMLRKVDEEVDGTSSTSGRGEQETAPSGFSLATNDSVVPIDIEGKGEDENIDPPSDAVGDKQRHSHASPRYSSLTVIVNEIDLPSHAAQIQGGDGMVDSSMPMEVMSTPFASASGQAPREPQVVAGSPPTAASPHDGGGGGGGGKKATFMGHPNGGTSHQQGLQRRSSAAAEASSRHIPHSSPAAPTPSISPSRLPRSGSKSCQVRHVLRIAFMCFGDVWIHAHIHLCLSMIPTLHSLTAKMPVGAIALPDGTEDAKMNRRCVCGGWCMSCRCVMCVGADV